MVYDYDSFLSVYRVLLTGFGTDVGFFGILSTLEIYGG